MIVQFLNLSKKIAWLNSRNFDTECNFKLPSLGQEVFLKISNLLWSENYHFHSFLGEIGEILSEEDGYLIWDNNGIERVHFSREICFLMGIKLAQINLRSVFKPGTYRIHCLFVY